MNDTYIRKNHDYGDSFAQLRQRQPNSILVRLFDKYLRLETLMNGAGQQVKDENINDTLMDMANYCIMELVERGIAYEQRTVGMTAEEAGKLSIDVADALASRKPQTYRDKVAELWPDQLPYLACNGGEWCPNHYFENAQIGNCDAPLCAKCYRQPYNGEEIIYERH